MDENDENLEQLLPEVVFDEATEDELFEQGFESLSDDQPSEEEQIQKVIQENPQLTEEQVRSLFEENNQLIYGKFGEFNRSLQEVRQLASQAQQFVPQNVQVTAENFSKVREEFGEEFAAAMAHDLAQIQMQQVQSGFNQEQIDQYVSQKLEAAQNQFEMKLVSMAHPDWQDVVAGNEFAEWMQKQPPQIQEMLGNTWDSEFLTTAIGAFKSETSRKQQVTQKRNDRLAAAVTPSSNGAAAVYDEDDDFSAGFNSVKRN